VGVWFHILVLVSDGFHNLSDVVALAIGLWASKKSRSAKSMQYSYGFARTELLGALVNGCFLLSLAFYVFLEAIPKFILPAYPPDKISFLFIIGASVGLGLNAMGALVFFVTGKGHSHAGHSHEHGGGGGGHAPQKTVEEKRKKTLKEVPLSGSGKWAEVEPLLSPEKSPAVSSEQEMHSHTHDDGPSHSHAHDHHAADGAGGMEELKHDHHADHADEGHSHSHGSDGNDGHSHAGEHHADANLYAIFLHFLGDALSSVFVLATALLWYFFPCAGKGCVNWWIVYIDPATSLIVVGIILWTTVPLVKNVLSILLQKVPKGVDSDVITAQLRKVNGVVSVHDLHIWELVGGLNLASVHLDCVGDGSDFNETLQNVRKVFHRNKIHSVTVQPEFVGDDHPGRSHCETMCVSECIETWCCEPELDESGDNLHPL
jgi:zinc transporter 1